MFISVDFGRFLVAYLSIDTRSREDRKTSGFLLADFLMGGLDVIPNSQMSGNTAASQGCLFYAGFVSLCSPMRLKLLRLLPLELYGSI